MCICFYLVCAFSLYFLCFICYFRIKRIGKDKVLVYILRIYSHCLVSLLVVDLWFALLVETYAYVIAVVTAEGIVCKIPDKEKVAEEVEAENQYLLRERKTVSVKLLDILGDSRLLPPKVNVNIRMQANVNSYVHNINITIYILYV